MATEAELHERRLRAEELRSEIRATRMETVAVQTGASSDLEAAQLDAEIARLERERDVAVDERDGSVEAAARIMEEAVRAADPVGASQKDLEDEIRNAPLPNDPGTPETGDLVPNETVAGDLGITAGTNVPEGTETQATKAADEVRDDKASDSTTVEAELEAAVAQAKSDEVAANEQIKATGESAGSVGTTATGARKTGKGGSR